MEVKCYVVFVTLCAYAQHGYAFGRIGLCAYVRTYVYIYIRHIKIFKKIKQVQS